MSDQGQTRFNLVRNSTDIAQPSSGSSFGHFEPSVDYLHSVSFNYLDSPSTTSSTTYKIQLKNNAFTTYIGDRSSGGMETVSTITAIEIKG